MASFAGSNTIMIKIMKELRFILLVLVAGLFMASCTSDDPQPLPDPEGTEIPTAPENPDEPETPAAGTPIVLNDADKAVLSQTASFVSSFFKAVAAGEKDNVVVSPLSAQILLGMVANSSDTQLRAELCELLGTANLEALNNVSKKYMEALPALDPAKATVRMVNGVWTDKNLKVSNEFASVCQDVFGAQPQSVDFDDASIASVINAWVARESSNLIPGIVDEIPEGIVALLANVLYFNASWTAEFPEQFTSAKIFKGEKGSVKVPTMSTRSDLKYFSNTASTAVCVPYGNRSLEAVLMMPTPSTQSFDEWLASDFAEDLAAVEFKSEDIMLLLPRFKVESNEKLSDILMEMGAKSLRNAGALKIFTTAVEASHEIFQKSCLSVDEKGTEGASASYDFVVGSNGEETTPKEVAFNRPFVMLVRDTAGEAILFAAAIRNL